MPQILFKDSITSRQDLGIFTATGFYRSKTFQYGMFISTRDADWIAERMLKDLASPMGVLQCSIDRSKSKLMPGDLFKFSYTPWSITDLVMRCKKLDEEDLGSEELKIEALEDSDYSSTAADDTVIREGLGNTVPTTIEDLVNVDFIEAPYPVGGDSIMIIPLVAKEVGIENGYSVYFSYDSGISYEKIDTLNVFQVHGTLVSGGYSSSTYQLDDTVGFYVDFGTTPDEEIDKLQSISREQLFTAYNTTILKNGDDQEIIAWQNITPTVSGSSVYKIENIRRGWWDTTRQTWANGTDFWFMGNSYFRIIQHDALAPGKIGYFKYVPFSSSRNTELADAVVVSGTIEGRAKKPYLPNNFTVSGTRPFTHYTGDIVLQWSTRNRGDGLGRYTLNNILYDEVYNWEGYYEIDVVVSGTTVRTKTAIDARTWIYDETTNLSDNGSLPDEIVFRLSNYITSAGIKFSSDEATITVRKV